VASDWEPVHTIHDYYDGPRSGATELNGEPYWYQSIYLDGEWNHAEDRFELTPLSRELLGLDLERDAIFSRWDKARKNGDINWTEGNDLFGALPDEMQRYRELNATLDTFLANTKPIHLARGHFAPDGTQVQWQLLVETDSHS
jgi:hypothetical protein